MQSLPNETALNCYTVGHKSIQQYMVYIYTCMLPQNDLHNNIYRGDLYTCIIFGVAIKTPGYKRRPDQLHKRTQVCWCAVVRMYSIYAPAIPYPIQKPCYICIPIWLYVPKTAIQGRDPVHKQLYIYIHLSI